MTKIGYAGYRFPPVIIQQAVWLYARFTLSFRDVEACSWPVLFPASSDTH
jgi:transposase-like protein